MFNSSDDIELSPVQNLMDYAMKNDVNSLIDDPNVKSQVEEFMKGLKSDDLDTDEIIADDNEEDLAPLIFGDKTSLYDRLKKK